MGDSMIRRRTRRFWTERTRILAFMLLVMIPAAALIGVSYLHLRSIQRDHAVEAAIQRDYQQVLAIAGKRIVKQTNEAAEQVRAEFPNCPAELEAFLANHPETSHAFIFDADSGLDFRYQPAKAGDANFEKDSEKIKSTLSKWFDLDGQEFSTKLKSMDAKDGRKAYITAMWLSHDGDDWLYQPLVVFVIDKVADAHNSKVHPALAGFVWDRDYIYKTFFPKTLNAVVPSEDAPSSDRPQTAITIRSAKTSATIASSDGWDGGDPELERPLDASFQGLVLGIKLRGTTIADMSQRFLRTNFIILGALSLLLGGGIVLTYRNVAREVALAKLKADFVSNVSHELRTPLALIRLYAETLELGRLPNPDKQHEYHQIIRKESERLTALINNILDFSRIEAGRKEYEFRETDLADLVRSTLESYRFEIEQNGFQFEQNIEENLPRLEVDREAIARSLLNLVNNAVKYSSKEKFLSITLGRSNGSVRLAVADHGIGIPTQEQHKIFEKFYRVGDPLVHNTKGSGLGLSLVRHIAQAHGGDVSVESTPGRGSTFVITLPVQSSTTPREARRAIA